MSDVTVTDKAPAPTPQDQPGSRTPDGTIKDIREPTPNPEPKTDGATEKPDDKGASFLTGKPEAKSDDKSVDDAGEGKTEGDKPDDAPTGAPDKYEDFKLPDGYTFDADALKEVSSLFKEMNLPQAAAQKLVDYYAKNSLQASQAPYQEWARLQKDWMSEIGDRFGSRSEAVRTDIGKAINSLPPSLARNFRAALDLTGAGSHPDIVEGLSILLKGHVEGGSVRQGSPSPAANKAPGEPTRPSAAEAMYPHLIPNRTQ